MPKNKIEQMVGRVNEVDTPKRHLSKLNSLSLTKSIFGEGEEVIIELDKIGSLRSSCVYRLFEKYCLALTT